MVIFANLFLEIKKRKKPAVLFLLILLVIFGFVLRAYNFSDWLRFNMDQSRDTILIQNLIEKGELPALGPKAGGTNFRLGPAFYHFQYASAKIFGAEPDKLAYPDLLFSVLAIILLYLLAKAYFKTPIALALAGLYSISYFAVKFSRFAWNPNSTPFFVMLFIYSVYKSAIALGKEKYAWAVLAGVALGVSVQLHASLLIIMPVFSVFALGFLFFRKKTGIVAVALIFATAILVNASQISNEVRTGGINTLELIAGAENKSERSSGFEKNLALDLSCHINSNSHILTSLGDEDECDYKHDLNTIRKLGGKKMSLAQKISSVLFFVFSLGFSLGGYFLLWTNIKSETDPKKKTFLAILSGYVVLSFLFYLSWATELSIRFFLPLSFVPFLLAGFWIKLILEKIKGRRRLIFAIFAILLLSFFNLQKLAYAYRDLAYGGREIGGDFDYLTLGEGKYIVDFIRENSTDKKIYIDAQAGYLFKFLRPLQFLGKKHALEIAQLEKDTALSPGAELIYIKSADRGCAMSDKSSKKYDIVKCSNYRQFSIFVLKTK